MDQELFRSGKLSTNYINDEFPDGYWGAAPTAFQRDLMAAVACAMHRVFTRRAAPELMRDDWVVIENGERRLVHETNVFALKIDFLDVGRSLTLEAIDWRPGMP